MEDTLITLLESLSYPVFRQGSLSDGEPYPATFITFWNNEEAGVSFYDNNDFLVSYLYDVNVYSNDPTLTYSVLSSARALLKLNGWTIIERGYDVASDEITHTGRGMRVLYIEQIQ